MFECKTQPNQRYFDRYCRFMDYCNTRLLDTQQYIERHHIQPRSLGGSDNEANLIDLTAREHYLAHWMLAKAFGGTQWYAFHMMNHEHRRCKRPYHNSRFYATCRAELVRVASEKFKGRYVSDETRAKQSNIQSNKIWVTDGHEEQTLQKEQVDEFLINNPTYYKGRSPAYHESMRNNWAQRNNRMVVHHVDTGKRIYVTEQEAQDLGPKWQRGQPDWHRERNSEVATNSCFYHNPETGEQRRFPRGEQPEGWVNGRVQFNNRINDCYTSFNLLTGEKVRIPKGESWPFHAHTYKDQCRWMFAINIGGQYYCCTHADQFASFVEQTYPELHVLHNDKNKRLQRDRLDQKFGSGNLKGWTLLDYGIDRIPIDHFPKWYKQHKPHWINKSPLN